MKITDEMVEAFKRGQHIAILQDCAGDNLIRQTLKAVAPMIARAEAEEIAVMADLAYEAAQEIGLKHPRNSDSRSRMFARAREIEQFGRAIRARHATSEEPRQSPPPSTPQIS